MKELVYQVTFSSDVVLPATSNTEGNIEQLDFIPGSNFLGMVAKHYDDFENSFVVFHSGAVKFGDAHILHEGDTTYKTPLSYFHKKADTTLFYNHHLLREKDFASEEKGGLGQLKQKRKGYISKGNVVSYVEYNYSQKSAYDKDVRRSKDSSMFGYSAIKSGTKWQFSIKIDENISQKDRELIKKSIEGKKRLGKSKSAEYGLIEIKEQGSLQNITNSFSNELILYANSRLALVDNEGNPTYELHHLFEGLTQENIVYEKCQIRTSTFTPYNGKRKTKDYERVCINKGSVIVLQGVAKESIPEYVGAFLSEGFGHILLNPSFLLQNEFSLKKRREEKEEKKPSEITSPLAQFLQKRETEKQKQLTTLNSVDKFISDYYEKLYSNIKPSQWGKIRSICRSDIKNFKDEIEKYTENGKKTLTEEQIRMLLIKEYISKGTKAWESKQIETLLQEKHTLEFVKLLSIQMPKQGGKS